MRGTRHSEGQIIGILKQSDNGVKSSEICRQHGIVSGGIKGSQFGRFKWAPVSAEIASRRTGGAAA